MTAKKIAIYFLRKKTGLTNEQIGKIFNMSSAAVSMAAVCLVKEMVADNGIKKIVERVDCSFKV
jgi:chromosomal replication initiation ATPase DnaA